MVLPDGRRTRWSPQGYWYVGPVGVVAEHVIVDQELRRDGTTAELRTTDWQIAGAFVLTG
jgi:phosphate-selective porin OprO/OprP